MRRCALAVLAVALILSSIVPALSQPSVVVAEIEGSIDEGKVYLLKRASEAASRGTLVLVIESYGGYLKAMDEMIYLVKSCSCRVVAWVPPGSKAVSAATGVALAAGRLYMGKGAVIGACKPVPADEKVEAYMVSRIKSLLEEKNVTDAETIARELVLESKALTAGEAVAMGVADGEADTLEELLRAEGLEGAPIQRITADVVSDVVSLLTDPGVAVLMLVLGLLLIAMELHVTGFQGWGVAGAALVLIALYTFGLVGVSLLTFALLALGMALVLLELLKPGVQVFGLGGAALIGLAVALEYYTQPYAVLSSASLAAMVILGLTAVFVGFVVVKASQTLKMRVPSIEERLVGKEGVAKTDIRPGKRGVVLVESEDWSAESAEEIKAGERVVVERVEGLTLFVRKATEK